MIITKEVELTLGSKNFTHLKKKYKLDNNLKSGDKFIIPIENLSKGSHFIIDVKCDYCNKELKVPYKRYNLNTKNVNKYACSSRECSNQKIKDVCLFKYGVENPFQAKFVKEKSKKSLQEKYGVDHPMYSQSIKNKMFKTSLERYGETSYTKTSEYTEKTIKTNLERYGVEYNMKLPEFQKRRKETRIKKGNQVPDELIDPFVLYRKRVDNFTDRNREKIFNNWDGYDYYDGEYIKDNFNLPPTNRNYPSYDHKISVLYGFLNKIPIEKIACFENICITKTSFNSQKRELNEVEFLSLIKNRND